MSSALDREGIFKAEPFNWEVFKADSGAVAVNVGFIVTAALNAENEWDDWTEYEDQHCYGNWWVVKKDGTVNQGAVDQLAACLGWDGNLGTVKSTDAPETIVQIKVKEDVYNGVTRYKATWMNPENYVPTGGGASEEDVKELQARFGSLLRAAASSVQTPESKPKPEPVPVGAADEPPPLRDENIPFAWALPLLLVGLLA